MRHEKYRREEIKIRTISVHHGIPWQIIRPAINTATQIERVIYVLVGTEESDVEPGFIPGWLPFALCPDGNFFVNIEELFKIPEPIIQLPVK